jgi:hypothetical protein
LHQNATVWYGGIPSIKCIQVTKSKGVDNLFVGVIVFAKKQDENGNKVLEQLNNQVSKVQTKVDPTDAPFPTDPASYSFDLGNASDFVCLIPMYEKDFGMTRVTLKKLNFKYEEATNTLSKTTAHIPNIPFLGFIIPNQEWEDVVQELIKGLLDDDFIDMITLKAENVGNTTHHLKGTSHKSRDAHYEVTVNLEIS